MMDAIEAALKLPQYGLLGFLFVLLLAPLGLSVYCIGLLYKAYNQNQDEKSTYQSKEIESRVLLAEAIQSFRDSNKDLKEIILNQKR